MKSKLHNAKLVCRLLALLILFQSCIAYKRTPITISEAAQSNQRVLIITNTNKRIPLRKIEKTESLFYGIKKVKGQLVQIPLNENDIKKIRPKDPVASTFGSIVLFFLVAALIVIPILINDFNNSWGSFGEE